MSCKLSHLALAVPLGVALSLGWSGSAGAATLTVTDFGDNGSPGQLRALINAAAAGDTIVIPAGTITLAGPAGEDLNAGGDLDILKNLTIQGAGAGVTIIDGGAVDGVFDIPAPAKAVVVITGVTIRNGLSVQAGGGGIRNFGTLKLANSVVSGNLAERQFGGGAFNFGGGIRNLGTLTLTGVTVSGNDARGQGGGLYNEQGAVMTLTDVTVSGNTAERDGAGILNFGTATLTDVTVSDNKADLSGGGILTGGAVVSAASATLTNVTVSGNHANAFGGGIFNSGTATLTNVTVSGNGTSSPASGGGISSAGSTSVKNVLLAGNSSGGADGNCSGTITSLGHNLDSGTTCRLAGAGDLSSTAPNLGPLQDNTGSTFTLALLAGSPAIDAGASDGCPLTDQRGVARPQGASCDIGAYEAGSGGSTPTNPKGAGGGGCGSGGGSPSSLAGALLTLVALWGWKRSLRQRA